MDMHFDGVIFQTHAAELARRIERPFPPFLVIDVRPRSEWEEGHVPGAICLSPEELEGGLPPDTTATTEFFLVGRGPTDPSVRHASLALGRHGALRRVEAPGGMLEWRQMGCQVASEHPAAA